MRTKTGVKMLYTFLVLSLIHFQCSTTFSVDTGPIIYSNGTKEDTIHVKELAVSNSLVLTAKQKAADPEQKVFEAFNYATLYWAMSNPYIQVSCDIFFQRRVYWTLH